MTTLTDTGVLAGRYLSHLRRRPELLVNAVGFPILMLLIFVFLFGGMMVVPGGGDYRSALLPGLFTLTMLFGVSATMVAVVTDAQLGITDRFRSMPMSPAAVLVGRAVADMAVSTLALAVLLLAGLAVGWRATQGPGPALGAVGLLLLLRFALLWVGIYLGLVVRGPGSVPAVQSPGVPGRVPVRPVRGAREHAGGGVHDRGVEPALGHRRRGPRAVRQPRVGRRVLGRPASVTAAVLWPLLILAVFVPLSVRRYREMGR